MFDAAQGLRIDEYRERLQRELGVICQMGFPGYFLVVADLIQHAKLPRELAARLDPSVRDEYTRLWEIVQTIPPPE